MPSLIFVYGTLRRGYDHRMARHLADHATWRGVATCRGKLYRISTYPGLVVSDDPADIVHGDLYALRDDALLATLDDYEGCGLNDPTPHPYARVIIDVFLPDGLTSSAWTYAYQLPVDALPFIVHGRFA